MKRIAGILIFALSIHPAAALTVTSLLDGVPGSLREAVALAPPGAIVDFAPGLTGTIPLTNEIAITQPLTILGPGARFIKVSGATNRVFNISVTAIVNLSGLTLSGRVYGANGRDGDPGHPAGWDGAAAYAGCILQTGVLTMTNCVVEYSLAIAGAGGAGFFASNCPNPTNNCSVYIEVSDGGGNGGTAEAGAILSNGNLLLHGCTFRDNRAVGGHGGTGARSSRTGNAGGNGGEAIAGAIYKFYGLDSSFAAINCTFYGNAAVGGTGGTGGDSVLMIEGGRGGTGGNAKGGAICKEEICGSPFPCTLESCTLNSNYVQPGAAGQPGAGGYAVNALPGLGWGGAVKATGLSAHNTILAGNLALGLAVSAPDVSGEVASDGFNLIGDPTGNNWIFMPGDQHGTALTPLAPGLGPLQDNGGPTPTQALMAGSPALDAGTSTGASLDQRGISRPQDQPGTANLNGSDGSDIGAFEFNTAAAGYAQKWLQIPDTTPNGYDVQASMPTMLADDFRCTATGPITQVRLWGSWRYDDVAPAPCFRLGIWSDVPAQPGTNSHPGIQLCEFYFSPGQYTNRIYLQGTTEWFLDPNFPEFVGTDTNIWEYIFDLPASPPCWQTNGNIYWLSLAAECFEVGPTMFGWKTCPTNWNDDAVFGHYWPNSGPLGDWRELRRLDQSSSLDLAFEIVTGFSNPPPQICVESNGVKYAQPPNLNGGFDVWNSAPPPPGFNQSWILADDFVCTNTGTITDIHLWGSWRNDQPLTNALAFWLAVYDDVPANPTNAYSHPGKLLWQQYFAPGEYIEGRWGIGTESFLDPGSRLPLGPDSEVWYYCFYPTSLVQTGSVTLPTTYWLAAFSIVPEGYTNMFGWKSTPSLTQDVSVHTRCFGYFPMSDATWIPTTCVIPTNASLDLAFKLNTTTTSCPPLAVHCAVDRTVPCGAPWEFDPPYISGGCCGSNYTIQPMTATNGICPQSITRTWTVTDCGGSSTFCAQTVTIVDTTPPLITCTDKSVPCGTPWAFDRPAAYDACCGTNVTLQLLSSNLISAGQCPAVWAGGWQATDCCGNSAICTQRVTVVDLAPPNVSCTDKTIHCGAAWTFDPPRGTDLCCGTNLSVELLSSNLVSSSQCGNLWAGAWRVLDCCGNATVCTQLVSVLNTAPGRLICPPDKTVVDGTAWTFDPPAFTDPCCSNLVLFQYEADVTNGFGCRRTITRSTLAADCCSGEICRQTVTIICPGAKWEQPPATGFNAVDVRATAPKVLADDFRCNATGPITKIRIWTASRYDQVPPQPPRFTLGLWSDQPAGIDSYHSHPLELLCSRVFEPNQYSYEIVPLDFRVPFYDPNTQVLLEAADRLLWECTFEFPVENACWQTNGNIYWLSMSADGFNTDQYMFGWRAAATNWNDDAVFGHLNALGQPLGDWQELRDPRSPFYSVDLAFEIITTPHTPLEIDCPPDIVVVTCRSNVPVTWPETTTGGCDPVTISSAPASGTWFDRDTTNVVTVIASDACGNTTNCTFLVIICRPELKITIANTPGSISVSWDDGGVLQESTNLAAGWTDLPAATSPYTVAPAGAQRFYRLRCP